MKKLFFLILLLTSIIYSQGWNNTVTTSIEVSNPITMDLFTNKDGNHLIIQNGYSNYYLKYYLVNSSGTVVRNSTIETTSSAMFPNISGNDDEVYIVYKKGSNLEAIKSTNAGISWSDDIDPVSVGNNTCNGVDIVSDARGLHVVYAMQDNGDDYETYYRLIDDDEWGSREDVTGYGTEVGGSPTVTVSSNRVHVGYNTGNQTDPRMNQGSAKTRDKYNTSWQTPQLVFSYNSLRETVFARSDSLFDFYTKIEESGDEQYTADLYVKKRSVGETTWSSSTLLEETIDVIVAVSPVLTSDNTIHIVHDDGYVAYKNYDGNVWSTTEYISSGIIRNSAKLSSVSNDLYSVWNDQSNYYIKYRQYDAAPLTPANFAGTTYNNHPKLNWTLNNEPDMSGYEIYRLLTSGSGVFELLTTVSASTSSYIDNGVQLGGSSMGKVFYKIRAKDNDPYYSAYTNQIIYSYSGLNKVTAENRSFEYQLSANYPNPFNPSTQIKYSLAQDADVTLKVYDMLGTEVAKLVNETQAAGSYEINFNASNLSSGVYIYRITATNNGRILFTDSKQMILLR